MSRVESNVAPQAECIPAACCACPQSVVAGQRVHATVGSSCLKVTFRSLLRGSQGPKNRKAVAVAWVTMSQETRISGVYVINLTDRRSQA